MFKEMVQNADDAGATEVTDAASRCPSVYPKPCKPGQVHFVWDWRQHRRHVSGMLRACRVVMSLLYCSISNIIIIILLLIIIVIIIIIIIIQVTCMFR